jgi:hypothetical protein
VLRQAGIKRCVSSAIRGSAGSFTGPISTSNSVTAPNGGIQSSQSYVGVSGWRQEVIYCPGTHRSGFGNGAVLLSTIAPLHLFRKVTVSCRTNLVHSVDTRERVSYRAIPFKKNTVNVETRPRERSKIVMSGNKIRKTVTPRLRGTQSRREVKVGSQAEEPMGRDD